MRPRPMFYLLLLVPLYFIFFFVHKAMVYTTATFEPQKYFSILDEEIHKPGEEFPTFTPVIPAYTEATASSLTIDGKDLFRTSKFLLITPYDTIVTLQIDSQSPIQAASVVMYFNEEHPRVAWQVTVDSEWQSVEFDQVNNVTITP